MGKKRAQRQARICQCCGRTFYVFSWQANRKYCLTAPGTIKGTSCRGMTRRLASGNTRTGRVTFRALANTPGMEFLLDDPRILGLRRGELRFLADGQE